MSLGLAFALVLQVTPQLEPAPGTTYDPAIPTLEEVAGHDFGEAITPPADIVRYMEALAEAAPERSALIRYGETWEGRPLIMLALGSAENMARLDAIRAGLGRLADPRGLDGGEAERLTGDLPVVVALVHGVHGNEISSSGAAMAQAYHLLAATNDPRTDLIRENAIVLIDPAENPDGRARFIAQNQLGRAAHPDPDPLSAEHDEPWPGGRANHYLFDLNRDWFIQSQVETRGRTETLLEWHPQVVVDLHEMGGNSTYFFPPPADPVNPWVTERQRDQWELLGSSIADVFDERGFAYFNRESYDAFYPGYGDSWPMGHGAVAMTFEQASARGLVYERDDGTVLTYNEGVVHHFTAGLTTAYTAAANRERLLRDYLDFHRTALELDEDGVRTYVLTSAHDPAMARRLAQLLVRNGIEVVEATETLEIDGRSLEAGSTYLVPLEQPASRLARNLLDPDVEMDPEFFARQVERLANRLPHEMYDVTAWSLPILFDVEAIPLRSTLGIDTRPVAAEDPEAGPTIGPTARVAYLLPWGTATAAAVSQALQEDLPVRVAGAEFVLEGRRYPIGTAVLRAPLLDEDDRDRLYRIAAEHGAEVVAVDSGYIDEGISLGSSQVRPLPKARVALAWGEGTRSLSAGWARYVIERRYGRPVSAIRAGTLRSADLNDYDVIVLPSGSYSGVFGGGFVERLRMWMQTGGTLVTVARATEWAAEAGLLSTSTESRAAADEGEGEAQAGAGGGQPIDYLDAIQPDEEDPIVISGSLLNGVLDTDHWLASGTDGEVGVMVEGTRIFTPLTLDQGTNVGRYAAGDTLVASGIVWEQSRAQFMNKAFLMHQPVGRGHLIAFAEDPNYRAYTESGMLLFMNAVLLGPGF